MTRNVMPWMALFAILISVLLCSLPSPATSIYGFSEGAAPVIDPDIAESEFNHHVAGYSLVAMGLLIIAVLRSPRLRALRFVWPLIFIAIGLFLAIWSDKEIWPIGPLSWTWLIHHDAEARQHKIYALLMIVIGILELQRARGKLGPFWSRWSLPILAALGAIFLLFHAHGGGSGLPPGWDDAEKQAKVAAMRANGEVPANAVAAQGAPSPNTAGDPHAATAMDPAMHDHGAMHHSMDQMAQAPAADPPAAGAAMSGGHEGMNHAGHHMTPEMLHIKSEHLAYTIVGLALALFKFAADGSFFRSRVVPYLWPGTMVVLGILLTTYTETVK